MWEGIVVLAMVGLAYGIWRSRNGKRSQESGRRTDGSGRGGAGSGEKKHDTEDRVDGR